MNNNLKNNKTAQETIYLYLAIIINIFLGWILTKFNTKYLSVEEFGKYIFFIILIYYGRVFFSIGLFESTSRLLALKKDPINQRQIFGATALLTLLIILAFSIFVYIFSFFANSLLNIDISMLCQIFAWAAGLVVLQSFINTTLKGNGAIKQLALFTFLPRVFYLVLILFLIYYDQFTLNNSITALFLGLGLAFIIAIFKIKPLFNNLILKINEIKQEVRSYGIHIYISSILHETLFHSDKILISLFLDAESMAFYGLAYMLTFPLSHFSSSLATTLFNKFVSQNSINVKVLKTNLIFVSVSVLTFIFLREPIIRLFFSDKYFATIDLMFPLAMAFGFSGLSKPYSLYLMARGKGRIIRNISIIVPTLNISLNLIFIPILGIIGVAWSAFISYLLDLILCFYNYNKNKI